MTKPYHITPEQTLRIWEDTIRNLKGDEILMESRILAVADVVESMASNRPYRPTLGIQAALEEIDKNKGILYDVNVADACLRLFQEKGYQFS